MVDIMTPAQEFETPADALAHYGVKGMKWGVRREGRLQRLERVASGQGSKKDVAKTAYLDTALGNKSKQIDAQLRAARELKSATEKGEATAKVLVKYYGTRSVPRLASMTINRPPKS